MDISVRQVLPEILDHTDARDPAAIRSRLDLRRVHLAMRTVSVMKRALRGMRLARTPSSILELGGGDGTLLLRLARELRWPRVSLTLLDLEDLVSPATRAGYRALGWRLQVMQIDALQWAAEPAAAHYDLCLASLFLHHFEDPDLACLLRAIARDCDALVACEPRRDVISLLGSRVIGILGANHITRQDAFTSVIAGFNQREISAAWPAEAGCWIRAEYPAFPFTHCFTARLP